MYIIIVSTSIFYRKALFKTDLIVVAMNWQKGENGDFGLHDLIVLLTKWYGNPFAFDYVLFLFPG